MEQEIQYVRNVLVQYGYYDLIDKGDLIENLTDRMILYVGEFLLRISKLPPNEDLVLYIERFFDLTNRQQYIGFDGKNKAFNYSDENGNTPLTNAINTSDNSDLRLVRSLAAFGAKLDMKDCIMEKMNSTEFPPHFKYMIWPLIKPLYDDDATNRILSSALQEYIEYLELHPEKYIIHSIRTTTWTLPMIEGFDQRLDVVDNITGHNVLISAINNQKIPVSVVKYLANHNDVYVNHMDNDGLTPLIHAMILVSANKLFSSNYRRALLIMRDLIDIGADRTYSNDRFNYREIYTMTADVVYLLESYERGSKYKYDIFTILEASEENDEELYQKANAVFKFIDEVVGDIVNNQNDISLLFIIERVREHKAMQRVLEFYLKDTVKSRNNAKFKIAARYINMQIAKDLVIHGPGTLEMLNFMIDGVQEIKYSDDDKKRMIQRLNISMEELEERLE